MLTDAQKQTNEENKRQALLKLKAKSKQSEHSGKPCASEKNISVTLQPKFKLDKLIANCVLKPNFRFAVLCKYHQKLIELLKTFSSKQYDPELREWSFSLDEYSVIFDKINKNFSQTITVQPLPAWVFWKPENSCEMNWGSISPYLRARLLLFQQNGVEWCIKRGGRVIIADEMGLGKTVQSLVIAWYYRKFWPLLIICPTSLKEGWLKAIKTWLEISEDQVHFISTSNTPVHPSDDSINITIVSYDMVSRIGDKLLSCKFNVVICDESHSLKNLKTLRSQKVIPIIKRSRYALLLSGTPALSRPVELFGQLNAVAPTHFRNIIEFGKRYCAGFQGKFGWDFSGSSNLEELELVLQNTVLLRRMKNEVLDQLAQKNREIIFLDVDLKHADENFASSQRQVAKMKDEDILKSHSLLLEFFASTAVAKKKAVCNYITNLLSSKDPSHHKFLVFAHHVVMLNSICEVLHSKSIDYIRIDGSTKSRQNLVDNFQNDSNCRVAVLSIKAAGTGLTLTAARLVIFAELFWNPGLLVQAEDRAHRIGTTETVRIVYLLAKNSADDRVWPLIIKKLDILNQAGLSKNELRNVASSVSSPKPTNHCLDEYFPKVSDQEMEAWFDETFEDDELFKEPENKKLC